MTKCRTLKTDAQDQKIYYNTVCRRVHASFSLEILCWGSEGVKSHTAKQGGKEGKEGNNAQTAMC